MDRRNFLRLASSLSTMVPAWALTPAAFAQSASPYSGKVLININARGGLDQSSWVDPREADRSINTYARVRPAGVAGNIRYAPMGNNASFFTKYFRQILVINGVHSETNSHEDGERVNATGRLDMGYPNISELFASTNGRSLPMAWLSNGGFSSSAGLVPPTPVPSGSVFSSMAQTNLASSTTDWMKQADVTLAQMTRTQRLQALNANGGLLPRTQQVIDQSLQAGDTRAALSRVAAVTPRTFDPMSDAHIALLAVVAGFTTTVQLTPSSSRFGFDSHQDHDSRYAESLPVLTNLVDYIWQKSADLGISNRIVLRIFSDFGRTGLNNNNGKDHWSVGSQVLMEANPVWGNRVFGASGPKHEVQKISPAGAVDPARGFVITPRHIHAALRQYLDINTTDPRFNLKVPASETFDFFNPAARTGYPTL